jgi:hypothetical protein
VAPRLADLKTNKMSATQLINKFKVYEPSERDTIGTVSSLIPKGKLKFIPNTITKYQNGVNKAIGIILINQAGESTTLPLSKRVSKGIVDAFEAGKSKKELLGAIAKLEVTQFEHNTTGEMCQVVSAPIGEAGTEEEYTVADLGKSTVTFEELI